MLLAHAAARSCMVQPRERTGPSPARGKQLTRASIQYIHMHHIQTVLWPAVAGLRPGRRGPDTQWDRHIVPHYYTPPPLSFCFHGCAAGALFHPDLHELSSVSCQARSLLSGGRLTLCPPRWQALTVLPLNSLQCGIGFGIVM